MALLSIDRMDKQIERAVSAGDQSSPYINIYLICNLIRGARCERNQNVEANVPVAVDVLMNRSGRKKNDFWGIHRVLRSKAYPKSKIFSGV